MYLVQRNNKTIAVKADLESAMADFAIEVFYANQYIHANQYPHTWLKVIDEISGKVEAYWAG